MTQVFTRGLRFCVRVRRDTQAATRRPRTPQAAAARAQHRTPRQHQHPLPHRAPGTARALPSDQRHHPFPHKTLRDERGTYDKLHTARSVFNQVNRQKRKRPHQGYYGHKALREKFSFVSFVSSIPSFARNF